MRRHKQELSKEECMEILTNEPRGVLALLGDDDYPYALPMYMLMEKSTFMEQWRAIRMMQSKDVTRYLTV